MKEKLNAFCDEDYEEEWKFFEIIQKASIKEEMQNVAFLG